MSIKVSNIVKFFAREVENDKELAIKLHNYVRDHVRFGFTQEFDRVNIQLTLKKGLGHCNTKSALLTKLFNEAGFESYQHFIIIRKELLLGALPYLIYSLLPNHISHSLTDVNIYSKWYSLDSHVLDLPLFYAVQNQLIKLNRRIGFGSFINATCNWDGESSTFSQAGDKLVWIADHGRISSVDEYYRSKSNQNKLSGIFEISNCLKTMGNLGSLWEGFVNQKLMRLRYSTSLISQD